MGTRNHAAVPTTAGWLAGVLLLAACSLGGNGSAARHSPSPSAATPSASLGPSPSAQPAPSPHPVTGAYGVLYSSQEQGSYSVSIVDIDGKVVASASVPTPQIPNCGNVAAALIPPPVSTSNAAVYFMDANGGVWTLAPDGTKSGSPIINLPAPTTSRRSMFAVSPDDAEMAVVVDDFTSSGATTKLYMDQLQLGGSQTLLYSETGSFTLWPIGWHGTNNLVVGKIGACTQGGGPFVGTPQELHVVDPATATRRFVIGSSTCPPVNRPSPAGVVCENPPSATVLNWTAGTVHTYTIQGPVGAYLSPSGGNVAFVDNTGTTFTSSGSAMAGLFTCAWIDDTHVLGGGSIQPQPRVGNVTNGQVVPVAAQGDCGGRIPGSL